MRIRIGHLYPDLMCIYADRGNVLCLSRRLEWRGIDHTVEAIRLGDPLDPAAYDILFMGGGQDREQRLVCEDFQRVKGSALREAAEGDVVILAVCGGYQLMGHYYRDVDGTELPGVGLFDAYTIPAPGKPRLIGNVVAESALPKTGDSHPFRPPGLTHCSASGVAKWVAVPGFREHTLVGFENHGGRTHLGSGCAPLARIVVGGGNNGEDGTEGAVYRNAFGTYLHGSVLPKNPWFADLLLERAVRRHDSGANLAPLDDHLEHEARVAAKRRARETR